MPATPPAGRGAPRSDGVLTRRDLLGAGWTDMRISRACRDGRLERLAPGVYFDGAAQPSVTSRIGALQQALGDDLVAVLDTAAFLHGLPTPWPSDDRIHLAGAQGRERPQRRGLCLHTWLLAPHDVVLVRGVAVTTPERTLVDLMCLRDRMSAVAAVDAALHADLVTAGDVERLAVATRARRGAARCRPWWKECDGRAESPLETRVRLRAADAGYPPSELQKRFDVPGGHVRADLAWRRPGGRWLIGEADGSEVHGSPSALLRDRWRANALVGLGDVDVVRFTWGDTVSARRVGATLAPLLDRDLGRTNARGAPER